MTRTLARSVVGVFLVLTCVVAARARGDDGPRPFDRWYVLEMGGQRAGWMHSVRRVEDGRVISTSEMKLEVRRGELAIGVAMDSLFEETLAGEPVRMRSVMDLGTGKAATTTYEYKQDGITITRDAAAGAKSEAAALPEGAWLPPAAAGVYASKRLAAGATEITVRTIDPSSGAEPVTIVRREIEPTNVETLGKIVPAFRCVSTVSNFQGIETVEFIDDQGEVIRSDTKMGPFTITLLLADRELALSELDPPELMQSLFIKPDRPIENARGSRRAVFTVSVPDGEMPLLPSEGVQRAERIDNTRQRLTVDIDAVATTLGQGESAETYTESTPALQCDDPEVAALARSAGGADDQPPARIAENLRQGVYRHMNRKALSVGFATAAESVRTREGDCTEHAVLLAALLRARGIPSRVVSGVIYADSFAGSDDIFGYHMWTQALLPDRDGTPRWVDLDATLPGANAFDATHIAISVSDLAGDVPVNGLVALAPLMGRLKIDVESVQ